MSETRYSEREDRDRRRDKDRRDKSLSKVSTLNNAVMAQNTETDSG